jgi:hypothetical protein
MASISPICKKCKKFISALKSPSYMDFMIKKSLKSKTSKSHTWAPLKGDQWGAGCPLPLCRNYRKTSFSKAYVFK